MSEELKFGGRIYYVPRYDSRLARYILITRVRLSHPPPIVVLGEHVVISPNKKKNGNVAKTKIGSFWVSKEAYEAHQAYLSQPVWRRLALALRSAARKSKIQFLALLE